MTIKELYEQLGEMIEHGLENKKIYVSDGEYEVSDVYINDGKLWIE